VIRKTPIRVKKGDLEVDVPADDVTNDRDWVASYRMLHRDEPESKSRYIRASAPTSVGIHVPFSSSPTTSDSMNRMLTSSCHVGRDVTDFSDICGTVGFLAGWISAPVGFAAPVAIAAMAFSAYFSEVVLGVNPLVLSLAIVTICTLVLLRDLRLGSGFQNGSTTLKVALVLVIIGAGLWVKKTQPVSFCPPKAMDR
jgi:amino acid transporter